MVAEVVRLVVVHALDSNDVGLYLRSILWVQPNIPKWKRLTRAAVRSRIGTGIDMSINTLISDYIGRTRKVRRTAYAEPLATVAIIVAKTCSFTVK